jgi:trimethylamine--corrinoid protein Co-methyltransferase
MITQSNYREYQRPQFRRLADDQLKGLHHASLEILERTGVCLYEQEALDLMRKAGLTVDEGNRVRVPPTLIEWALSVAPRISGDESTPSWSGLPAEYRRGPWVTTTSFV